VSQFEFKQVDVFSTVALKGNPVAVVLNADSLTDQQMADFARWTNLSETTFVLKPQNPEADYRLRIFTTLRELPFAGHPTLGSCHAWLEAGGKPRGEEIIQECAVGLIRVRRQNGLLAFTAPPLGSTMVPAGWGCCCAIANRCWR
jgi:PhzF family phenazine biosynthesis protein